MASFIRPDTGKDGERLKGWKEIADFLRVHPRTVQRWIGRELRVPVHRIYTGRGSIIYAVPAELDSWMRSDEGKEASAAADSQRRADVARTVARVSGQGNETPEPSARAVLPCLPELEAGACATTGARDDDVAPGIAHEPADGTTQLGRNKRLATKLTVAAALLTTALVGVPLLYTYLAPRAESPRPSSDPARTHPVKKLGLRLTFADGSTASMGVGADRPLTVGVGDQTFVVSIQFVAVNVLMRVSRVSAKGGAPEEVAAVILRQGDTVDLPQTLEIKSIEWLRPGTLRPKPTDPST